MKQMGRNIELGGKDETVLTLRASYERLKKEKNKVLKGAELEKSAELLKKNIRDK
ncbi:hypothetical protein KM1_286340 [Entamoeba histolytica HM-3:IMSS]|uniref:Uncharacterized protein n=1 Tax=Entamoeba histolytica HM-3:IMSS TaxID=885315 RepID=M7W8A3_ENTHI|nr:hypothetical protein KM1_286340 [Entamoeba histolytica HM-3:IMSS]